MNGFNMGKVFEDIFGSANKNSKPSTKSDVYDFKEYTRIRDIVRKRNIRLAEQGLSDVVHFPTVKEIKSGLVSAKEAFKAIKNYYSGGSTVKAVKQTGQVPEVRKFPEMPKTERLSAAEKKERKRQQDRQYRQRRKLRNEAINSVQAKLHISYLKALETVAKRWKEAGLDIGINLRNMTPSEAQAFVEYMDYRFSQGDFTQMYVVDEFIRDFSRLKNKGYKLNDIIKDFNQFLEDRAQLQRNAENMTGMTSGAMMDLWYQFGMR